MEATPASLNSSDLCLMIADQDRC